MKKYIKDVLLGLIAFISWGIAFFGLNLVFDKYFPKDPEITETSLTDLFSDRSLMLNILLVLFGSALLTFIFAWFAKPASMRDSLTKSMIWSGIFVVWYVLIGLMNNTAGEIFISYWFYTVLIFYFAGPLIFAAVKKLPKKDAG